VGCTLAATDFYTNKLICGFRAQNYCKYICVCYVGRNRV
jgi:hypothetical protein